MFATRRFKAGRPLEASLEKAFDALAKMPPPPPQGAQSKPAAQPDPAAHALAAADIQSKAQVAQINAGITQQKNTQDFQIAQEKNQTDAAYKAASLQLQERAQDAKEAKDAADVINAQRQAVAKMGDAPQARAKGGPVTAGKPYLVGEHGPEVVIPRNSGVVVPNERIDLARDAIFQTAGDRAVAIAQATAEAASLHQELAASLNQKAWVGRASIARDPQDIQEEYSRALQTLEKAQGAKVWSQ